jgi:hypothetical protein
VGVQKSRSGAVVLDMRLYSGLSCSSDSSRGSEPPRTFHQDLLAKGSTLSGGEGRGAHEHIHTRRTEVHTHAHEKVSDERKD